MDNQDKITENAEKTAMNQSSETSGTDAKHSSGLKKLTMQIGKFGIVGVIAFFIDYGVLMLLSQGFKIDPVIAAAISFVISTIFNYLASMRFVFAHREELSRRKEFIIFVILSVIGLGFNEIIMSIGVALIGTSAMAVTITKVIATGLVMIWNFCSRKKWLDATPSENAA